MYAPVCYRGARRRNVVRSEQKRVGCKRTLFATNSHTRPWRETPSKHRATLFWRLQLALEPTHHLVGFQRIKAVTFEALKRGLSLTVARRR